MGMIRRFPKDFPPVLPSLCNLSITSFPAWFGFSPLASFLFMSPPLLHFVPVSFYKALLFRPSLWFLWNFRRPPEWGEFPPPSPLDLRCPVPPTVDVSLIASVFFGISFSPRRFFYSSLRSYYVPLSGGDHSPSSFLRNVSSPFRVPFPFLGFFADFPPDHTTFFIP